MKKNDSEEKMAMNAAGVRLLLIGLIVMISGYILMIGGNSDDPQVFSEGIFDFQRLVAAPIVIVAGIIIEIVAILKVFKSK